MNGLGTVGTLLTVVLVVSLVALAAEIGYVLWRRRRFRRQNLGDGDPEFAGQSISPSKELLYFFCWKSQSRRIEPNPAQSVVVPPPEVDDVLKWQGLYGSRVLFTIKEEEREETDSENCFAAENRVRTRSRECLEESLAAMTVTVEVDEATPFSTPCASPPYYTPLPSPPRQAEHSTDDILLGMSSVS